MEATLWSWTASRPCDLGQNLGSPEWGNLIDRRYLSTTEANVATFFKKIGVFVCAVISLRHGCSSAAKLSQKRQQLCVNCAVFSKKRLYTSLLFDVLTDNNRFFGRLYAYTTDEILTRARSPQEMYHLNSHTRCPTWKLLELF